MRHKNAANASLDGAVFAEQVRLLFRKRFVLGLNLVLATLTAVVFGPLFPYRLGLVWVALFGIVAVTRLLISSFFADSMQSLEMARRASRAYTATMLATASLWGLAGSVVLVTTDLEYQVLIVFLLAGLTAGGIFNNATYRPAMFAFLLPTTLPLIVMLALRRSDVNLELAVMFGLFSSVLTVIGMNIGKTLTENVRLRIQQEWLTGDLRASESTMAEAQAAARIGSFEFDPVTHTIACTAEVFRIFGLDPATFDSTYETLIGRVHVADRTALVESFGEFERTGKTAESDIRIVMDDGAIKYLHATGHCVVGSDGRTPRFITTVQDVTEETTSANELQYRDSLLHAVMTGTAILLETDSIDTGMPQALKILGESMRLDRVGLVQLSGDGSSTARYEWHSPSAPGAPDPARFTTRASQLAAMADARGQLAMGNVSIAQRAAGPGPFFALLEYMDIESVLVAPVAVEHKLWGIINADSCREVRVWTANEIDTLKTFAGIAGSIVARNAAKAKLQLANMLLETQMEASPDGILVVDPHLKIISINQSCIEMWALTPGVLQDARTALARGSLLIKDRRKYLERVEYLDQHRDLDSEDEIELVDGENG